MSEQTVDGAQGGGASGGTVTVGSGGVTTGAGGSGGGVHDAGLGGAIATGSGGHCNSMAGCVGAENIGFWLPGQDVSHVCPPGHDCYEAPGCYTVWCSHLRMGLKPCAGEEDASDADGPDAADSSTDAAVCDPEAERNRDYYYYQRRLCVGVECRLCGIVTCPPHTTPFVSDFGCGCEQDASCPSSVDCRSDAAPDSTLCTIERQAACPYTVWAGL